MKNSLILKKEHTFFDIVKKIDEGGNGFILILDDTNFVIGIVTDGDIRRAILNKNKKVKDLINKNPIVFPHSKSRADAKRFLMSIHRKQLPIVDENNRLLDIIFLHEDEMNFKPNYVVIMAGGMGTRLGELTKDTPKPMLHIGGKPILENIVKSFIDGGFNKFIFCVNYKSDIIKNYFENGEKFGVEIIYIEEEQRMGTAGALSLIKNKIEDPFFVVNGDILTTVEYDDFLNYHESKNSIATMGVKEFEFQLPYARVKTNNQDQLLSLEEKPVYSNLINSGVYILNPEVINYIPKNEFFDMTSLFESLISKNKMIYTYEINDYWLDIGHKADYTKANNDINIDN
jgi:dTDP-glucose pyrophosphorylase